MKVLLKLSLAALMVSSALAAGSLSLTDFVNNVQVQNLAPHLVHEIDTQGIESFTTPQDDSPITAGLKIPLLDDIIQIVSMNIFNAKDADWSRLENARLRLIQEHGADALTEAAKLTETDTRQAALVLKTIYDTVINLPAASKETLKKEDSASTKSEDSTATEDEKKTEEKKKTTKDDKITEEKKDGEKDKKDSSSASLLNTAWEYLGLGLITTSDTAKKVQGIVTPRAVCETTDTAYLKGVDNVVYYSSLTHGLAGGALVSAPSDSAAKSLDLGSIITAIGKLAIEINMAQSVARLADLDLTDPAVRTITYLALTAENAESPAAQTARDINNLINKGVSNLIPEAVLHSLADQAALVLITRGASGSAAGGPSLLSGIPVLRNVFAFSSDVLNANNIGDVLKYVFCPDASHVTKPAKVKVVVDEIKKGTEETTDKTKESAQKVLKVPEDAVKKVTDETKKVTEDAKIATDKVIQDGKKQAADVRDNIRDTAEKVGEKVKDAADAASDKFNEAGQKIQDRVTEGTEKADAEAKKAAEEIRAKAEEIKTGAEETAEDAKKKAEDAGQKIAEEAKNVADKAQDKVEEIKQEL